MEKYSELAFNIIDNLLKIQNDNVISIAGEIHNASNSEDPLIEISLIEELALAIRKKKAFPVLELSTENLKKRFFSEMPDEIFSVPPSYYKNWINSIDIFIEVGWESFSSDFKETSEKQMKQFQDSTQSILEHLFEQKKKMIFLNFPTHELADYIGADFEKLRSIYFQAANCNYALLDVKGSDLKDEFYSYPNYRLVTRNEELELKIQREKIELFTGDTSDHQIIFIPTGIIEIPIERDSLNGVFFADKIYYKDKTYDNVKIKFENGNIRYVAFTLDVKGNYHLQSEFVNSMEECYLTIGFNKNISEFTNYYSYDRCINGNISLKFFDRSNHSIFVSNLKAEISKRM